MGYYTHYTLSMPLDAQEAFRQWLQPDSDQAFALCEDGTSNEQCKWYEHERDMAELSKLCPRALFILDCLGEDGARWRVYAKGGNTGRVEPRLDWPEPDWSKP